jgi:uncharacterized coiled-coil DUF342 family protein
MFFKRKKTKQERIDELRAEHQAFSEQLNRALDGLDDYEVDSEPYLEIYVDMQKALKNMKRVNRELKELGAGV